MEALWATILFSGFALEVIIRHSAGIDYLDVINSIRELLTLI
jgi:hypothetical protein